MPNITQLTLANITTTGAIQYIRDESLRGFGIKVTAKGKASFFVEARVKGGRSVRRNIGKVDLISLDDAKTEARLLLYQLGKGVDVGKIPAPAPPQPNSLKDVFKRYLEIRVNLRASTAHDYKKVMNNCFSDWFGLDVEGITQEMVAGKYRDLSSSKSDAYTKKALRTLKAILNSSGLVLNPVSQFMKTSGMSTIPRSRSRYLHAHEIAQVMEITREGDGTPNLFGDLLLFFLLTGCRRNEALSLLKTDYNPVNETITFRETKNGQDHTIPAYGFIKPIVERAIAASEREKIFDYTDSTYRTKLAKAQEYLSFDDHWTTHDLRRTFSEHCDLAGVDLAIRSSALNHAPVGVTLRNYTGGQLAKQENLRSCYEKLQRQYRAYLDDVGNVRVQPDWVL